MFNKSWTAILTCCRVFESFDIVGSPLTSYIYLFGVLCCFQHCTGHITTGSWKGRGNQYIQLVKALYCKLPTNGKQLPAFPLEAVPGTKPRSQRRDVRVLALCHHGPPHAILKYIDRWGEGGGRSFDGIAIWGSSVLKIIAKIQGFNLE